MSILWLYDDIDVHSFCSGRQIMPLLLPWTWHPPLSVLGFERTRMHAHAVSCLVSRVDPRYVTASLS